MIGGVVTKGVLVLGENAPEAAGKEPVKPPPPNDGGGPGTVLVVLFTVKFAVDDRPTNVFGNTRDAPLAGLVLIAVATLE